VRKLGVLILCGVFWLAGYYLGRRPGSPDIFGWLSRKILQVGVPGAGKMDDGTTTGGRDSRDPGEGQGEHSESSSSHLDPPDQG